MAFRGNNNNNNKQLKLKNKGSRYQQQYHQQNGHSHTGLNGNGISSSSKEDERLDLIVDSASGGTKRDVIQNIGFFQVEETSGQIYCGDPFNESPNVVVEKCKPGNWIVRVRKFRGVDCWIVAYHEDLGNFSNAVCVQGLIEPKHDKNRKGGTTVTSRITVWGKEGYIESDSGLVGIIDSEAYHVDALVPAAATDATAEVNRNPIMPDMPWFSYLAANVGKVLPFGCCFATGEGDFPCHSMRDVYGEAAAVRVVIAEERDLLRAERVVARAELAWPAFLDSGDTSVQFHLDVDVSDRVRERTEGPIAFLNEGLGRRRVKWLFKLRRWLSCVFLLSLGFAVFGVIVMVLGLLSEDARIILMFFSTLGVVLSAASIAINVWMEFKCWRRAREETQRRVDDLNGGSTAEVPLLPLSASAALDDDSTIWELQWSNQYVRVALFRTG